MLGWLPGGVQATSVYDGLALEGNTMSFSCSWTPAVPCSLTILATLVLHDSLDLFLDDVPHLLLHDGSHLFMHDSLHLFQYDGLHLFLHNFSDNIVHLFSCWYLSYTHFHCRERCLHLGQGLQYCLHHWRGTLTRLHPHCLALISLVRQGSPVKVLMLYPCSCRSCRSCRS